jgi:hypothetical protein
VFGSRWALLLAFSRYATVLGCLISKAYAGATATAVEVLQYALALELFDRLQEGQASAISD